MSKHLCDSCKLSTCPIYGDKKIDGVVVSSCESAEQFEEKLEEYTRIFLDTKDQDISTGLYSLFFNGEPKKYIHFGNNTFFEDNIFYPHIKALYDERIVCKNKDDHISDTLCLYRGYFDEFPEPHMKKPCSSYSHQNSESHVIDNTTTFSSRFMPNVKFCIMGDKREKLEKLLNFEYPYNYIATSDDGSFHKVCDYQGKFEEWDEKEVSIYEAIPELVPDGMVYDKDSDSLIPSPKKWGRVDNGKNYIAPDGEAFDTFDECLKYESKKLIPDYFPYNKESEDIDLCSSCSFRGSCSSADQLRCDKKNKYTIDGGEVLVSNQKLRDKIENLHIALKKKDKKIKNQAEQITIYQEKFGKIKDFINGVNK